MNNYYIIDWELRVIDIGQHDDFEEADEFAHKMRFDVLYLASQSSLATLKAKLNSMDI